LTNDGISTGGAEGLGAHAGELGRHFVPPACTTWRPGDADHVVEAKREQYRFLKPLIYNPGPVLFAGHARFPAIEQLKRRFNRITHLSARGEADRLARVPGVLDDGFEICVRHG
jgi:hypothetical protein